MADVNKDITLTLRFDDEGTVTGIRSVNDEVEHLGTEGSAQAQSFGDTMSVALGNLAADAAMQLAERMGQIISQGQKLVQRGAEIQGIQDRFNTVFRESSDVVQQFIDDQAQMMALSEVAAQDLIASAGAQAQALGFTREESAKFSQEIATLAGDLASFHDDDPQRAFEAITSALSGEREQLKQFDVILNQNMVNQRALSNTNKESAEALTQQERALASLTLMYENAGPAIGDAERTMDSASRTAARAETAWENVRNEMAQELIPVAAELNTELLDLAKSEEVMDTVQAAAKELSDQLVEGIRLASDFIQMFSDNREQIVQTAQTTRRLVEAVGAYVAGMKAYTLWTRRAVVVQKAATAAQWAFNTALSSNPIGAVIAGLTALLGYLRVYDLETSHAEESTKEYAKRLEETRDRVDELSESTADLTEEERKRRVERLKEQRRQALDTMQEIDQQLTKTRGELEENMKAQQGMTRISANYTSKLQAEINALEKKQEEAQNVVQSASQQIQMVQQQSEETDDNTESVEENTEAVEENKEAREEMPEAPGVPEVEPDNQVIEQEAEFSGRLTLGVEGIEASLRHGLIESISQAETAMQTLQKAYNTAKTDQAHQEIQALINKLEQAKGQMEETANSTSISMDDVAGAVQQFGQGMAQAMQDFQQASEEHSRAAFAAYKAFAIAEAVASTYLAANKALASAPPPLNFALMAAVIAQGLANVVKIKNAEPSQSSTDAGGGARQSEPSRGNVPRMRSGGRVEEGQPVLVGDGPGGRITPYTEMFVPDRSGTIVPRSQLSVAGGARPTGSGDGLEQKLDEVAQRFEQKQFRLRGTDQVTQQERVQAVNDDAGIK